MGYVRDGLESLPDESKPPIRERERLCSISPSRPNITNLNIITAGLVASSNGEKWQHVVKCCNRTQDTGFLWKLIGTATGKNLRTLQNQQITFNKQEFSH